MLSMQISYFLSCQLLQLFHWTNTYNLLSVIWDPQGNRITPVSISGKTPIFSLLKPVIEPFLLNWFRYPVSFMIIFHQVLLEICYLNEPSWYCFVNQRSVTSPAVWIVMNLCTTLDKSSFLLYVFNDDFVGLLYI